MLTPAEAFDLIGQHLPDLPVESLPLQQCASAVLREDIYAERDQPPFDRVAMDALRSTAAAWVLAYGCCASRDAAGGDPPQTLEGAGVCIEVMTGAVLPVGCDAVIPVEHLSVRGTEAHLAADLAVLPWQNIHRRATDTRQGALLLSAGMRLDAPEIAIAASAGMARIRVAAQPAIAVISTGNELIEPGRTRSASPGAAFKRLRHRRGSKASGFRASRGRSRAR